MKKILSLAFLLMLSLSVFAQRQVTKFLGIPVDGSRTDMIEELKDKGFTEEKYGDVLEGKFNGTNVAIRVQTNNNKVWRLLVRYNNSFDKGQIKIQYNNLIDQFSNNPRYKVAETEEVADEDDIDYEVGVKKKQYQAVFYQLPDDENIKNRVVWFTIREDHFKYQEYRIVIFYENKYNEANGDDL